jgi:predicted transcriptional regulator
MEPENEEAEFIAAVEEGLRALEEGRVVSHEEVRARFRRFLLQLRKN